jgi:hypothetical protein
MEILNEMWTVSRLLLSDTFIVSALVLSDVSELSFKHTNIRMQIGPFIHMY